MYIVHVSADNLCHLPRPHHQSTIITHIHVCIIIIVTYIHAYMYNHVCMQSCCKANLSGFCFLPTQFGQHSLTHQHPARFD